MMSKTLKNIFCCFAVCLGTCFILIQPALADEADNKQIPLNQYGIRSPNPYVVDRFIEDGKLKRGVTEAVGNPPEYIGEEEVVTVISEEIENVEEEAPVFSFFNEEGEEEDSIYDVRYVRVYVVIAAEDDKQLILQSGAALRVLRNLY